VPNSERNHILADTNIGALLWRLSIPAMVGMGVMATYNLVDAIFIGRGVGTLGIAGLAICFPVQLIILAVGQLIGMGSASIISRALGAGDDARAHRAFGNALTLTFLFAATLTTGGFVFLDELLRIFGATEEILPYARDYLSIILWGTAFRCYAMSHSNIIRSEGRAKVAMTVMIIGAGVNIVLDPIFIFGLDMGMRGAALATVLAQACTTTFIAIYFASGRSSLSMRLSDLRLSPSIVRETLTVGASSFGRMVAGSAVVVILNRTLGHYGGNIAIATYGILNRLIHFAFMPMLGFSQALQPVAGYNYGARQFDRAKRALRISSIRSTIFAVGAFGVLIVFARPLIQLFTRDHRTGLPHARHPDNGRHHVPGSGARRAGALPESLAADHLPYPARPCASARDGTERRVRCVSHCRRACDGHHCDHALQGIRAAQPHGGSASARRRVVSAVLLPPRVGPRDPLDMTA
jgi:putative MATE family efflux protein